MIPDNARFRKIKHHPKDGKTEIVFEVPVTGDHDVHSVETSAAPAPDFTKALQGLAPAIIDLAELKGVAKPEDIEVRAVNVSYNKNDSVGIIFTGMRTLKRSGPMLVNTPLKLLEAGEGAGEDSLISDAAADAVDELFRETRLFLRGKRAQLDAFSDAGDAPKSDPLLDGERITRGLLALESAGLKAALILTGLAAKPGPEAFDKMDASFPDANKVVYLGRAPIALFNEMEPARGGVLSAIAVAWLCGAPPHAEDVAELDRLATDIATHPATLAPFFEPFPIAPGEEVELPGDGFEAMATEEQWTHLNRGQLDALVRRAEAAIAADVLVPVLSERAARGINRDDLASLSLPQLVLLIRYATSEGIERPAELDALESKWSGQTVPDDEPRPETAETGEFADASEPADGETEETSLATLTTWQEYKDHCNRFGKKCRRIDFEKLMDSREDRPGYRDPALRDEIAERRAAATATNEAATLPDIADAIGG